MGDYILQPWEITYLLFCNSSFSEACDDYGSP